MIPSVPDCAACKFFRISKRYKVLKDQVANATCAKYTYKTCACGARSNQTVKAARGSEKLCGAAGVGFIPMQLIQSTSDGNQGAGS